MKNGYKFVVKVRNIIYDKESLQQVVLEEITIWATHEGGTTVLEQLNFFNKIINVLLVVHLKIHEENKTLILLRSLLESYNHIVTICSTKRKLSS